MCFQVFKWFLKMIPIFSDLAREQADQTGYVLEDDVYPTVVLAAINAIGVCYYVRIGAREDYIDQVATYFR